MSREEFKQNKLNETANTVYKYGCLMLQTPYSGVLDIQNKINQNDIYDEPGFGLEQEHHITCLYGFHDTEIEDDKIQEIIDSFAKNSKEIVFKLNGIGLFENEKYDVLKYEIESEHLHELNGLCKTLPFTSDYPDYLPHMTIAYLKPCTGKSYIKRFENPITLSSQSFKYSKSDGTKVYFTI